VAFTAETINVAGIEIGASRGGSGQTVVYLHDILGDIHGQPEGTEDSLSFLDKLAESFDVIAPATPGYRASLDAQQAVYDLEDMALIYDDLLATISDEKATVVGLGLGGWIAAEVATRIPQRIGQLVLISPVGISLPDAPINRLIFPAFSPRGRSGFAEMRTLLFSDPENEEAKRLIPDPPGLTPEWQQTMRFCAKGSARIGWKPQFLYNRRLPQRLRRVTAKTLIIASQSDELVPFANFQTYLDGIAGAQLVEMDGSHMLPFDHPDEVAAQVAEFVKA
jgi:pimeloyl-ACP methyl ester carboxylesterase